MSTTEKPKTKGDLRIKSGVSKPGRKAAFKEAQKEIIKKFGTTFEKLSK
jgi:hypothetical protein